MAQVHQTYKVLKLMTYSYWLSLETLTADPTLSVVSSTSEIEKRKEKMREGEEGNPTFAVQSFDTKARRE